MTERGYFSQRNLIPGAVFLIFMLAYNFPSLLTLPNSQNFGGFIALAVALIGSPIIGFLISQGWWLIFQGQGTFYDWEACKKMRELYQINEEDKKKVGILYDYILHSGIHSDEKIKGLSSYAFRRNDNFVLLATTQISLVLSLIFGLVTSLSMFIYPNLSTLELSEIFFFTNFWAIIISTIIIVFLYLILRSGISWIKTEYNEMHIAIFRESKKYCSIKELKEVFPDYKIGDDKKIP